MAESKRVPAACRRKREAEPGNCLVEASVGRDLRLVNNCISLVVVSLVLGLFVGRTCLNRVDVGC